VSTRRLGIIINALTGRMGMNQYLILWLLKFPRRAEGLEISAYLQYQCRHHQVFSALASLGLDLLALRHRVTVLPPRSGVRPGCMANICLTDAQKWLC
jgi:hypothetical protein